MKRTATVTIHNGKLMAEVVRNEACQECHACQFGQKQKVYVDLPKGSFKEGDSVELELDDLDFSKATLVAYALPVALLFAGMFVAKAFTEKDWVLALAAVAGLCVGLAIIRLFGKRMEKPRVCEKDDGGK